MSGILLAALLLLASAGVGQASGARSFFGIVPMEDLQGQDLHRLEVSKVHVVRWMFHWQSVQPQQGVPPNWASLDQFILKMAEHGVRAQPFFYGPPRWAASSQRKPPLGSPAARQGWKDFVRQAVERYGPGGLFWTLHPTIHPKPIMAVQAWNEQNSAGYWKPRPSVHGYAKLLRITDQAVRSANPKVKVLLGGMFGSPDSAGSKTSWSFLGHLYEAGRTKRHFDGVAVHPYSPDLAGTKFQVKKLREQMKAHHDRRTGLWVTELGSASGHGISQLNLGTRGQVRMLRRSFRLLLHRRRAWNIKQVDWFTWRDPRGDIPSCEFCLTAGLFKHNFQPKPSWRAFKHFTRR